MATERRVAAAVDRAVETATVVPDAPVEERVRYEPEALAAVVRCCGSARSTDRVLAVVDVAVRRWIDALDPDRTLAAVTLRRRVEAATAKRQVVVENLQGDVGSGRGPQT